MVPHVRRRRFRMLPAPTQRPWDRELDESARAASSSRAVATVGTAPPYGQRAGWMPRNQSVGDVLCHRTGVLIPMRVFRAGKVVLVEASRF